MSDHAREMEEIIQILSNDLREMKRMVAALVVQKGAQKKESDENMEPTESSINEDSDQNGSGVSAPNRSTEPERKVYGKPLADGVAQCMEDMLVKVPAKHVVENILKEFIVPENAQFMEVQKMESAIWDSLSEQSRAKDLELKNVQGLVSMASVCLARMAEKVAKGFPGLPQEWQKDVLTLILKNATITGRINQSLIDQRKKESGNPLAFRQTRAHRRPSPYTTQRNANGSKGKLNGSAARTRGGV